MPAWICKNLHTKILWTAKMADKEAPDNVSTDDAESLPPKPEIEVDLPLPTKPGVVGNTGADAQFKVWNLLEDLHYLMFKFNYWKHYIDLQCNFNCSVELFNCRTKQIWLNICNELVGLLQHKQLPLKFVKLLQDEPLCEYWICFSSVSHIINMSFIVISDVRSTVTIRDFGRWRRLRNTRVWWNLWYYSMGRLWHSLCCGLA